MKKLSILSAVGVVLAAVAVAWISPGSADSAAQGRAGTNADAPATQALIPGNFESLAKLARPAVVNIRTVKTIRGGGPVFRHFFGGPFGKQSPFEKFFNPHGGRFPERDHKQQSLGSGFIIDRDGYIVTNNHVVEGADRIRVHLADNKQYDAEVVGRDANTDLALIRIKADGSLTPIAMGDSDTLNVGSWVVAIGSPFGLEQTVTAGIVSAKGRVIGAGLYDDFIQTDASINPGNSGGPLINMAGEVVGINTAIVARGQGVGFAIPINLAREVAAQLKKDGAVSRGWLGVGIQDLTEELADYYGLGQAEGVLVTRVFEGDPADKAGIKAGDVILAVNGRDVASGRALSLAVAGVGVGNKMRVTVLRDEKKKTFRVTTTRREDGAVQAGTDDGPVVEKSGRFGLTLSPLTPEAARHYGYDPREGGVLVTGVEPDSPAHKSGVRTGDLIKEVNRRPVASPGEVVSGFKPGGKETVIQVLVKRGRAGFLAFKLEGPDRP
jgi:serine protease Do